MHVEQYSQSEEFPPKPCNDLWCWKSHWQDIGDNQNSSLLFLQDAISWNQDGKAYCTQKWKTVYFLWPTLSCLQITTVVDHVQNKERTVLLSPLVHNGKSSSTLKWSSTRWTGIVKRMKPQSFLMLLSRCSLWFILQKQVASGKNSELTQCLGGRVCRDWELRNHTALEISPSMRSCSSQGRISAASLLVSLIPVISLFLLSLLLFCLVSAQCTLDTVGLPSQLYQAFADQPLLKYVGEGAYEEVPPFLQWFTVPVVVFQEGWLAWSK